MAAVVLGAVAPSSTPDRVDAVSWRRDRARSHELDAVLLADVGHDTTNGYFAASMTES
jgi:hypothetical protein